LGFARVVKALLRVGLGESQALDLAWMLQVSYILPEEGVSSAPLGQQASMMT